MLIKKNSMHSSYVSVALTNVVDYRVYGLTLLREYSCIQQMYMKNHMYLHVSQSVEKEVQLSVASMALVEIHVYSTYIKYMYICQNTDTNILKV